MPARNNRFHRLCAILSAESLTGPGLRLPPKISATSRLRFRTQNDGSPGPLSALLTVAVTAAATALILHVVDPGTTLRSSRHPHVEFRLGRRTPRSPERTLHVDLARLIGQRIITRMAG